jgi:hypothetical protein
MNEEFDHEGTDAIVCPHCGHEHPDSWEVSGRFDAGQRRCGQCNGLYRWEREIITTYTTTAQFTSEELAARERKENHVAG